MTRKKLLILLGSVCLALVLAALLLPACVPAAPPEVAELEKEVAAEKAKVAELEAEIAELRAPVEVVKITFQSVSACPLELDTIEYIKENVAKVSEGRLQIEIIPGEAITPIEEMLDATRDGITDMLLDWSLYFPEKIPTIRVMDAVQLLFQTRDDFDAVFNKLGVGEIVGQAYTEYGVHRVVGWTQFPGDGLTSKVPVPDFESLAGLKIRCGGSMGHYLEAAGASTVWMPGEEIYTALASGLVDGATWGGPGDFIESGFHEVSKYWVLPSFEKCVSLVLLANQDFWDSLSEADQTLIYNVSLVAGDYHNYRSMWKHYEALKRADELGCTVQYWSADSINKFAAVAVSAMQRPTDPRGLEALDILLDYVRSMGYIE